MKKRLRKRNDSEWLWMPVRNNAGIAWGIWFWRSR